MSNRLRNILDKYVDDENCINHIVEDYNEEFEDDEDNDDDVI